MESWRPAGCGCSPAPKSRGDEVASCELMTCGGARRGSRSFQFYTSNEGVAVSKTYPRGIKHYFLFLKSINHRILTGYVSGRIGAVSEYRGSIRQDTRTF